MASISITCFGLTLCRIYKIKKMLVNISWNKSWIIACFDKRKQKKRNTQTLNNKNCFLNLIFHQKNRTQPVIHFCKTFSRNRLKSVFGCVYFKCFTWKWFRENCPSVFVKKTLPVIFQIFKSHINFAKPLTFFQNTAEWTWVLYHIHSTVHSI